MRLSASRITIAAAVLAAFILALATLPAAPEQVPSHWNASGGIDSYMPKEAGLFFVPLLMAGIAALLMVIPRIDPRRANIELFREAYDWFVALIVIFLFTIEVMVVLYAIGLPVSPNQFLPVPFGIVIIGAGILIGRAKPNWTAGIRTPWTLSSDTVWEKTHALGSRLFIIAGIVAMAGVLIPKFAFVLIFAPVILASVATVVYSYLLWRQEETDREKD
jgi:uncharacterized membrane protein